MNQAAVLPAPGGFARFCREFWWFGLKEARACIFAGSFFVVLALSTKLPLGPLPRYDFILLAALLIQGLLIATRLETWDEVKTISLFHLLGFALEVFKTHPAIGSWHYPEFAYSKVLGVPLYSGFMYAAVASYMAQAWRIMDLRLTGYPSYWLSLPLCAAIYLNFFTHHFLPDLRWLLIGATVLVFARTRVYFHPLETPRWMPMPIAFVLIGFFVWLAENIATFFRAWQYPEQAAGWTLVHWGKISSWGLLVILSFIVIADLKHLKARRAMPGQPQNTRSNPISQ